jgi:uncharacterized protein YdhG (YjbR/CyaY superfamily)
MTFGSHDEYLAKVPPDARRRLRTIQAKVEAVVPGTSRCISYNMPAFKRGRVFFYFAAFKKHIGIYPPVTQNARLVKELAPYRGKKGNLSFQLEDKLPIELIGRVALALSKEYGK